MLRNIKSFNVSEIEEKVLALWKEKGVFAKSLKPKKKSAPTFHFWEGPPTANGRPGIHHVLARTFKDIFPRYKTMQGFVVPRKGGWDTHGLPVEIQVEKQLGISSKKEIEKYGVEAFNKACKESVWLYKNEWEKITDRMGYWIDLDHPYITYENSYIETLWTIIRRIWDQKLLYRGYKIVNWCPRCGTGLSSHELAQGYKETTDTSVYVKFRLELGQKIGSFVVDKNTFVLSWTTTPWTLPGNVALAVGKNISYSVLTSDRDGHTFILASDLVKTIFPKFEGKEVAQVKGKDLIGLAYEPLFDVPPLHSDASYKIYPADFVTTTDGTGVVHTAVMYGEDDYQLGIKIGLPQHHTVDETGHFTRDVKELTGKEAKNEETEKTIIAYLKEKGLLLASVPYTHEYPFCWRCDTPLLYYARSSWFVRMPSLKSRLLSFNQKINWIPAHIKKGRFGEWLKDVKDWNFSRERYWGTPLPIWECEKCSDTYVAKSLEDLNAHAPYTNTYYLVRHGEARANVEGWIASGKESGSFISKLTQKGEQQIEAVAKKLSRNGLDIVVASPYHRTQQTAKILAEKTGAKIITEKRLGEIQVGEFNHKNIDAYESFFEKQTDRLESAPPQGESLLDVRKRAYETLQEIQRTYQGKRIALVSHGDVLWMLEAAMQHTPHTKEVFSLPYIQPGTMRSVSYENIPTDSLGIIDMHRPYVDQIQVGCNACGARMQRVPEVADVWFDSGSMPFAQEHWPFEEKKRTRGKEKKITMPENFPADYIAEGVDQTRGWFYTLLAVSTLLGARTPPYQNVIALGLIHDKNGQKMSKSRGNVVDPWMIMDKYGADALRWYLATLNSPGDAKNFDENEVGAILRRFILTIYHSFVFLHTYGKHKISIAEKPSSSHALDRWICSRLATVAGQVTKHMESYDALKAASALEHFAVEDLSRWYIRRSRRRLQRPSNAKDYAAASATLAYVLKELSLFLAPFIPFFSEALYQSLKKEFLFSAKDSVHLEPWPSYRKTASLSKLEEAMEHIRDIASGVLAKRSELGLKVRQPLGELFISYQIPSGSDKQQLVDTLADEVNVQKVTYRKGSEVFELDTTITPELKAQGTVREIIRAIQGLRQDAKYVPQDMVEIFLEAQTELLALVRSHEKEILADVGAKRVTPKRNEKVDAQAETKIDGMKVWIGIKKR